MGWAMFLIGSRLLNGRQNVRAMFAEAIAIDFHLFLGKWSVIQQILWCPLMNNLFKSEIYGRLMRFNAQL